ncbi:Uncharacterised protein [Staphylococcus aureus]|uniref:Transposon-related protein n=1 Tax=Staphylococcus aureus TaxID=1280 RepID=A0A380E9A3_STAAU|nr:Uncharacterised protein [Staphylococcus aureus]
MVSKNKKHANKNGKLFGSVIILLSLIGLIIYFVFQDHNELNKTVEIQSKKIKSLQKTMRKTKVNRRLDNKNVVKEEEALRRKAEDFVKVLYVTSTKTDDKKRYEKAKELRINHLLISILGETRRSPIKYETDIQDVKIYNEKYSPEKKEYHMYLTLTQAIKGSSDGIDKRKIASELMLKQEGNNIWKVNKFKQFDEEK